jgi:hypothetical protein
VETTKKSETEIQTEKEALDAEYQNLLESLQNSGKVKSQKKT